MASRVDADFDTLQPIDSTWRILPAGKTICRYEPGKALVTSKFAGKKTTRTVAVEKVVYDNEEGTFVFRSLPMADKYQAKVPIFTSIGGVEIGVGVEVQAKETVEIPMGKFPSFKVLLPEPINQVFWFSADEHRYITKIEAGGVLMPLAEVETFQPGEIKTYKNADLGFSLKLPPNWYAYRNKEADKEADKKSADTVCLLDPEADFDTTIQLTKLAELSAEEKKTPRDWAEKRLADKAKEWKDFQVRADSWQPLTISGRKSVSCVADFVAMDNRKMARFVVYLFGQDRAAVLGIDAPRNDLERMKRTIMPVVESLVVE